MKRLREILGWFLLVAFVGPSPGVYVLLLARPPRCDAPQRFWGARGKKTVISAAGPARSLPPGVLEQEKNRGAVSA